MEWADSQGKSALLGCRPILIGQTLKKPAELSLLRNLARDKIRTPATAATPKTPNILRRSFLEFRQFDQVEHPKADQQCSKDHSNHGDEQ
jgi:hypothetical protein